MPKSWVVRLADEERRRDQAHSREMADATHHAEVERFHLQCLMLALKDRVARDVAEFARELPDRRISFDESAFDDSFTVRRDCYPEGHLTVTPNSHEDTIRVQYLCASDGGLSAPKPLELVPEGDRGFAVYLKGATRSFGSVEQLAEFLLRPLFTGQAR